MEDRELLELAAKAMVLVHRGYTDCYDGHYSCAYNCARGLVLEHSDGSITVWSPLDDDGDALRLVAALKLNIEHMETMGRQSYGINCWPYGRGDCGATETEIADYQAALRRAIVRAAAEIGKQMQ